MAQLTTIVTNNVRIMLIPKDALDVNMNYLNLLTNHGEINLNMITKFEDTYIKKGTKSSIGCKYAVKLPDQFAFKILEI